MTPARPRLAFVDALRAFEARLHRRWASQEGAAPQGLRSYRAAWIQQFAGSGEARRYQDLLAACASADPVLISDFHPLGRSARMLARLLRETAWPRPPRVVLELLPAEVRVEAHALMSSEQLTLVDGRSLAETAPELLDAARAVNAEIIGAWVPGTPGQRDEAAAQAWVERRQSGRDVVPELLFFGDWHLADPHLPRQLAQRGARPVCIHQSPAPLWERTDPADEEAVLALTDGHYAWMHPPPLAFWTSARLGRDAHDGREAADTSARILEELSAGMAEILDLPAPAELPEVVDPQDWLGFWRSLPERERAALSPQLRPQAPMPHPEDALIWMPDCPSWNQLVDAAAGDLARGSRLAEAGQFGPWIAFRRIWARAWNPFLPTRSRASLRWELGIPHGTRPLPREAAPGDLLDEAVQGEAVAAALCRHPLLDRAALRTLLREGRHAFIWHHGMSTIQSSPLSA